MTAKYDPLIPEAEYAKKERLFTFPLSAFDVDVYAGGTTVRFGSRIVCHTWGGTQNFKYSRDPKWINCEFARQAIRLADQCRETEISAKFSPIFRLIQAYAEQHDYEPENIARFFREGCGEVGAEDFEL